MYINREHLTENKGKKWLSKNIKRYIINIMFEFECICYSYIYYNLNK